MGFGVTVSWLRLVWQHSLGNSDVYFAPQSKKPRTIRYGVLLIDAWQFPTLTWGDPTLPSALRRFTSEFGMGSGGTTALKPPGKFC